MSDPSVLFFRSQPFIKLSTPYVENAVPYFVDMSAALTSAIMMYCSSPLTLVTLDGIMVSGVPVDMLALPMLVVYRIKSKFDVVNAAGAVVNMMQARTRILDGRNAHVMRGMVVIVVAPEKFALFAAVWLIVM